MTSRAVAILLMLLETTVPSAAQKPLRRTRSGLMDEPPPATGDTVGEAGVVIVGVYTGNQRLHPDIRPTSMKCQLGAIFPPHRAGL